MTIKTGGLIFLADIVLIYGLIWLFIRGCDTDESRLEFTKSKERRDDETGIFIVRRDELGSVRERELQGEGSGKRGLLSKRREPPVPCVYCEIHRRGEGDPMPSDPESKD